MPDDRDNDDSTDPERDELDELGGLDDDETEVEVPEEIHTVCHLCGGAGMVADPKFAVVGGVARTVDNGRQCPECESVGHFPGIVPPL
ncbi:hypothetical protein [Labedaea rhizosphaerae]|uniref:Uncharacterized protein n=1 Tax=Labedaea rhizosphaerae TaxID=598644 RepID=A0A4R6RXL6_LABRH|nr:hypothetical protein [Labedaea rhizosphaerae]TDP91085.1 hypothetical protein EV186_10977 [Labedaea rhizosphaerae]